MTTRASGSFEVKMAPLPTDAPTLGRMSLDKTYHGDLEAVSKGEFLSAGTPGSGSAGYVAMERVNGKLDGKSGTFALQHSGSMNRGAVHYSVTVVPGTGTEELAGLEGKLSITIVDGKHFYDLEYTLEA
jgi:Protein of unknown function (DUF3224)